MPYLISFLEGIITFISPCLLPMIPLYITYFARGSENKKKTLINAVGFVIGFTIVFVSLGAFAGSLGSLVRGHRNIVNIITGSVVVVLGLNFLGIIKINFLNSTHKLQFENKGNGFVTSIIFGIVFSIGWTPCVGAFLGSALMLASKQGSALQGIFMLIAYSIGLGIPFIVSAFLIDRMKGTFDFIKKHYNIINKIAGIFLLIVGIAMMTGYMGYFLSFLS
ncbi:cytochrome c biogenesis protein CcdA [Anaerosacchariphilus polymeriproducens]|uniref:Cytochrome c biogenesis protein CcdA n=1 Tax=Anaerosacchariphilus polymeriproducens TaxID=1812858 RepID=A0A371AW18_9FIRM|nr:cytochrome c biogenesis CcdA family protein [Anaerosacchariphilus polymeriproducens]RDU23775.1 cytochrome c biogenesis protein CcdA [Anaerosacchariphilus polymeriproducens]